MKARSLLTLFSICVIGCSAMAAEKPTKKKQATEEEIQARLAEHARRKSAPTPAADAKRDIAPPADIGAPVKSKNTAATPTQKNAKSSAPASSPADNPAVLPPVDVRKDRITELDRQLEKQNKEIAREKKNTKPTPLDESLNGPKVSKVFALFGGQSSEDRSNIASERVAMMEEEREMIEAIDQATTKEEKEQLQKTLDSMRTMRRELERALH